MRLWEESARAGFEPLMPDGQAFPEPDRERFEAVLADPGVAVLVAERDAELIAYSTCGVSRDDDAASTMAEIRTFFVSPRSWGRGVGADLMGAVLEELRARGFAEVSVWSFTSNERANHFYERAGFARDGAEMLVEGGFAGLPAVRLRRSLS